jgi:hypothetical protein
MSKRKKVLTTMFSMKRAKARRHTGPARPDAYVERPGGFAKRNCENLVAFDPNAGNNAAAGVRPKVIWKRLGNDQKIRGVK